MRHGSLFSGIGGFDLAAEWMGWDNVFHCEWMPFPRKILSHYWPEAISYNDITATDFRQHEGSIDILTGGFPCQPYSAAGKRKGKNDDRHLWPHMLRCIREVKPRWVVGENVFGLATWNGGLVFEEVCVELEAEGYAVQPFVLPAAAVNAPHRRDRVWFVAYSDGLRGGQEYELQQTKLHKQYGEGEFTSDTNLHGLQQRNSDNEEYTSQGRQYAQRYTQQGDGDGDADDADSIGFEKRIAATESGEPRFGAGHADSDDGNADGQVSISVGTLRPCGNESAGIGGQSSWDRFPTQPPICGGDDGLPAQLDGITFPKWRAESIKGYGNAIVPQVALQIFKAIQQYEELKHES